MQPFLVRCAGKVYIIMRSLFGALRCRLGYGIYVVRWNTRSGRSRPDKEDGLCVLYAGGEMEIDLVLRCYGWEEGDLICDG